MSSAIHLVPTVRVPTAPGSGMAEPVYADPLRVLLVKPWPDDALGVGLYQGDVFGVERDAGLQWRVLTQLTIDGARFPDGTATATPHPELAYHDPCWIRATNGVAYGVATRGSQLSFFGYPTSSQSTVTEGVQGAAGIVQGPWGGAEGNFEVVAPSVGTGMDHLFLDNQLGAPGPGRPRPSWNRAAHFGDRETRAVRLILSDWSALELIAWERLDSGRFGLTHYFQNGHGGDWLRAVELPGSEQVSGVPGFIQSTLGLVDDGSGRGAGHGVFEVVAPHQTGGLMGWSRLNEPPWTWTQSETYRPADPDLNFDSVHLIQLGFRWPANVNIAPGPLVHHPYFALAETRPRSGIGAARLTGFYRNNQPVSGWGHGPIAVPPLP